MAGNPASDTYRERIRRSLCLVAVLALGACATVNGYPTTRVDKLPDATNSTYLVTGQEFRDSIDQDSRNELIQTKRRNIDSAYQDFEMSLYKQGLITDIGADWTLLGLAGAITLVGGEKTKETLGAISAFLIGGKASFDKRALLENTMTVIVQKMRALRAEVLVDIIEGTGDGFDEYGNHAAATDLSRYYLAGTVVAALSGLATTAAVEETDAMDEQDKAYKDIADKIAAAKKISFQEDKASNCLINFGYQDPIAGTTDVANFAAITAWKDNSEHKDLGYNDLFFGADGAAARVDAVNALVGSGDMSPCPM